MFFRGNAVKKSASIGFLAAAGLIGATNSSHAQANQKPAAIARPAVTAVPARLIAASVSAISSPENIDNETSKTNVTNANSSANNVNSEVSQVASDAVVENAAQRLTKPLTAPRVVVRIATSRKVAAKTLPKAPLKVTDRKVAASAVSSETVESYIMLSRLVSETKSRGVSKRVSDASRFEIVDYSHNTNTATSSTRTAAQPTTVSPTPTRVALLPPAQNTKTANVPALSRVTTSQPNVVADKVFATKPQIITAPVAQPAIVRAPVAQRKPANLSSRARDRVLLAQMENDLRRAQGRLNNANETLSRGQHQLMKISGMLQQAMLEAGSDAKGLHPFVRVAQRYAGTPYVWGGESRNGFDCSGFIIVVMRDLGYRALPHSAAEQFNYGTPIAKSLIKPGDIVFFKNTYKRGVSHVGIAIGRGRFIHAAGTGTGTIVSSLNEPKWILHYAGARRLVRN